MASPAEATERKTSSAAVPAAAAAASDSKRKEDNEQREAPGILRRIWRALFGGRGDDYETRLQHLSKEEADVLARMRRRTHFSRRGVRNLVVLSVLAERPSIFTVERKDRSSLERLRAERKAKIDELKEKTNYYLTQQLIQKYDFDPASKAAAASVLASKMGVETGLKLSMGDEAKSDSAQPRSSNIELQNRKGTKGKMSSQGSTTIADTQQEVSNESSSAGMEASQASKVLGHSQGSRTSGGWIAKVAAFLVGEDPSQSYALICGNCHMHNGLARKEDFPIVTYYCPHCHALNRSNQSIEQCPSSESGKLSPVATADGISTRDQTAETDMSSMAEVQELPSEGSAGKQLVDPAN